MTNIQCRFLFLLAGFPSIAYAPYMTGYDYKIAEQIAKHLGAGMDAEDVAEVQELDEALEDSMVKEDDKWGRNYDETR